MAEIRCGPGSPALPAGAIVTVDQVVIDRHGGDLEGRRSTVLVALEVALIDQDIPDLPDACLGDLPGEIIDSIERVGFVSSALLPAER
jgi:hypothetical protein